MISIPALITIITYIGAPLFLIGTAILFYQAAHGARLPRARYALGTLMLIWAMGAFASVFTSPPLGQVFDFRLMSVFTLVIGIFTTIICLLYPLELTRPGWITPRRLLRLSMPFLAVTAIYFSTLALLRQPIRTLGSFQEMLENIGEFNIWFRFVLYLTVCCYIAYLIQNTSVATISYERRCLGQPPIDPQLLLWIRLYGAGMILLTILYLALLLVNPPWLILLHRICCLLIYLMIVCAISRKPAQSTDTTDIRS